MEKERIYEKKYPPAGQRGEAEHATAGEPEALRRDFREMYRKMIEETTNLAIPGRMQASEQFIRTAIEVGQLYKLDTEITRYEDRITVRYAFDCCGGLKELNRVFGMADTFSFFKDIDGRDLTICMDYYTHAVLRGGKIVAP